MDGWVEGWITEQGDFHSKAPFLVYQERMVGIRPSITNENVNILAAARNISSEKEFGVVRRRTGGGRREIEELLQSPQVFRGHDSSEGTVGSDEDSS